MGTLRFFEEVVSFKIRRTFGFADYTYAVRTVKNAPKYLVTQSITHIFA